MTKANRNIERAKRCNAAILHYGTDVTGQGCLIDFLTDARHWCDQHGESFAELDRRAYQHYLVELDESGVASNQPRAELRNSAPKEGNRP